jgi:hypothetical protein
MGERKLAYIAAPYADPNPAVRAWNVARACLLARLAVSTGWAPIVVHPGIAAIYGEDETEELRALGLEVDIALLLHVRREGGFLWVLLRDDLSMSSGVAAEWRAWLLGRAPSDGQGWLVSTKELVCSWEDWRPSMSEAGLSQQWTALRARPEVPHG